MLVDRDIQLSWRKPVVALVDGKIEIGYWLGATLKKANREFPDVKLSASDKIIGVIVGCQWAEKPLSDSEWSDLLKGRQ